MLSWLIDMIGQEEEKEAILGYAMCLSGTGPHGAADAETLRSRASAYLAERFGVAHRIGAH